VVVTLPPPRSASSRSPAPSSSTRPSPRGCRLLLVLLPVEVVAHQHVVARIEGELRVVARDREDLGGLSRACTRMPPARLHGRLASRRSCRRPPAARTRVARPSRRRAHPGRPCRRGCRPRSPPWPRIASILARASSLSSLLSCQRPVSFGRAGCSAWRAEPAATARTRRLPASRPASTSRCASSASMRTGDRGRRREAQSAISVAPGILDREPSADSHDRPRSSFAPRGRPRTAPRAVSSQRGSGIPLMPSGGSMSSGPRRPMPTARASPGDRACVSARESGALAVPRSPSRAARGPPRAGATARDRAHRRASDQGSRHRRPRSRAWRLCCIFTKNASICGRLASMSWRTCCCCGSVSPRTAMRPGHQHRPSPVDGRLEHRLRPGHARAPRAAAMPIAVLATCRFIIPSCARLPSGRRRSSLHNVRPTSHEVLTAPQGPCKGCKRRGLTDPMPCRRWLDSPR